jgi:hypothetical protein
MTHPLHSSKSPSEIEAPGSDSERQSIKPSSLATFRALGYSHVPKSAPLLRGQPLNASRVIHNSSQLNHLLELAKNSNQRLYAVQSLLPPALRSSVKASTLEGDSWCLLVSNNAVMAKLKQLLPALAAHLRSKGFQVQTIRLKIEGR